MENGIVESARIFGKKYGEGNIVLRMHWRVEYVTTNILNNGAQDSANSIDFGTPPRDEMIDPNEYLNLMADLIAQHCHEENGVYDSGCISTNAEAIRLLCREGWMEIVHDGVGRNCSARFKSDGPITGFIGHSPEFSKERDK